MSEALTQAAMLAAFTVTSDDTVLELFHNATLDPTGFHAYCREAYQMLLPPDKRPDAKRKSRGHYGKAHKSKVSSDSSSEGRTSKAEDSGGRPKQ
jgi:hypothetical protein